MPSFKGNKKITLQPWDEQVPYAFEITVNSSETANDGHIPFGTNVSTATVSGTDEDGVAAAGLVDSSSLTSNVVTVLLSYPTGGEGRYHLRFKLTLDSGAVIEADYNRIDAKNL